ncbi:MAG TPA: hypothetical protein VFJ84_00150 [Candidatus Saccharimonadales bacterium]|nr:hypothetical protein [Candidatus Saccharimonadales bacterium]
MSEVLATLDPELPGGYEKLDGIEVVEQKDGSYRYNGLVELGEGDAKMIRRVQLPDLAEMWGYDPAESEAEWQERQADPEKWEMKRQIKELSGRLEALEAKNAELEARIEAKDPPPEPEARKVAYREPLSRRLRRRVTGEPEPPQYYQDEKGYFYLEDEQRVYVPPEAVERRDGGAGAALVALGAAAVAAFIGYELGKRGHSYSPDVTKIHKEVADIDQQLNIFEAQSSAQHIHDHQHELQAIHGLHEQIEKDHAQEMKAINGLRSGSGAGLHERAQDSGLYWGMRYPWDWAANKVGAWRAEGWLHTLAAKAAGHGHSVHWLAGGHGSEILQVDGRTDTGYVVDVLKQY